MSEEHAGNEIDLLDLGDATVETRQWTFWPLWFDSVFVRGEKEF
jgi:hypothetical protein